MDATKIITYTSFQELFGRRSSFEEFRERLTRYSKESVIYVCCLIGTLLELWKRGGADYRHYEMLIRSTFEPMMAAMLIHEASVRTPAFVFHRRQLLLLEKCALLYCPERGADALKDRPGYFGIVLLIMRNEIASSLKKHPLYTDICSQFATLAGLSLELFEKLCVAVFTKYNAITLRELQRSGDELYLRQRWFANLGISSEQMERFVDGIAATDDEYLEAFKARKHFGHNDFTALKDRPIYLEGRGGLPFDLLFVIDKFATGPFWRIHNAITSPAGRQAFRSFWGAVFEKYVHRIMEPSCKPPFNSYFPNPAFESDASEACDAVIVREDVLICLEYKANMFTAEAKYSGDPEILLREIRKKLIENEEGKQKGVSQLAATIDKLFGTVTWDRLNGIDISKICKVYPVLVTLDEIGGSFLITRRLGEAFKNARKATTPPTVEIMPVFSMNIEAFEVISGYLRSVPMDTILEEWRSQDPALASSILAVDHPAMQLSGGAKNEVLEKEFKDIWRELTLSVERGAADKEYSSETG